MNNYEEEYFEDENDLEEEHFGDFVDFWDDTPEFVGNYTIVEQKGNVYIIEVKGEQK